MTGRSEVQEAQSAVRHPPSRTVRPRHVAWTAGAVGAAWLAVLMISLFSPDLVSGSEPGWPWPATGVPPVAADRT